MARDRREGDDADEDRPWRRRREDDEYDAGGPRDDEYDERHTRDDRYDEYDDRRARPRFRDDNDYDDGRRPPLPKSFLAESILVLIFCCWPFAIPAIVNASSVNSLWVSGQYRAAKRASDQAQMWCWISFGLGLGIIGIYLLTVVLAVAAGG